MLLFSLEGILTSIVPLHYLSIRHGQIFKGEASTSIYADLREWKIILEI